LEDEKVVREMRKSAESWEQWMDQSGKPDCNSAPAISSFVSKCLEGSVSQEEIFEERHLVHHLITRIKQLSLDYPENRDHYYDALVKLNQMQEERLDHLTLDNLLNPSSHIDPESEDLVYKADDEISGLIYLLWGNFGKNPRRREVEWSEHKLKIELKKDQAIEDVALRVIYTDSDTLNLKLPELISTEPLSPPLPDEAETEEVLEDDETVKPAEDGEVEGEQKVPAESVTGESEKKEPSIVPSQVQPTEEAFETHSTLAAEGEAEPIEERSGLDGKEGIGGVWHIEYLSLPPLSKDKGEWKITRCYGDQLKRPKKTEETFNIALPVTDYPMNTKLTVGRWDGSEWTHDGIEISEEKDGSMYFNTNKLGAFRFFVDRHGSDGPVIDTWMLRPQGDIVELFIVFQNFQIQFDILPNGKINLVEKSETPFFPADTPKQNVDLDDLIASMEERGLFTFPTPESLQYIEKLDKQNEIAIRAYTNMASVAHLKRITSSSYNPALQQSELAFMVDDDTLVCTSDRFYVIEDKYIPPEPPQPPPETEEDNTEALEAYEEEKTRYEEFIKEQEADFSPDFEIPRDGCPMLATLAEVLQVKSQISQQNLTAYKLLKKTMVLEL